jgi:hypothetical protein
LVLAEANPIGREFPRAQLLFVYSPREDRVVQYDTAPMPLGESASAPDILDAQAGPAPQDFRPHAATLQVGSGADSYPPIFFPLYYPVCANGAGPMKQS